MLRLRHVLGYDLAQTVFDMMFRIFRVIDSRTLCHPCSKGFSTSPGLNGSVSHHMRFMKEKGNIAARDDFEYLTIPTLVEKLQCLFPTFSQAGDPINPKVKSEVTNLLQRTRLNPREWQQHAIFRRGRYTRNIVGYSTGQFVALLLCWEHGQQSPIHDHAGAHCFIKMLSGSLKEEHFELSPDGGVLPKVARQGLLSADDPMESVGFMHDSIGVHRVSNPNSAEIAVSLHIYAPPFAQCQIFPPTGAAPKSVSMVSGVTPAQDFVLGKREDPWFPSLCRFSTMLNGLKQSESYSGPQMILNMLGQVKLNSVEWAMYCHAAYFSEFHCTLNLIHCDADFSVVVACWNPGQKLPLHNIAKGRRTWVKVLSGSLRLQQSSSGNVAARKDPEELILLESSTHLLGEHDQKMHHFSNASETDPAISVHVFSPPMTQLGLHTERGFESKDIPMLLGPSGNIGHAYLGRSAGRRYLSFHDLVKLLDREFSNPDVSKDVITTILRKSVFNRDEWNLCLGNAFLGSTMPGPQKVLLAQRIGYSLQLCCWGSEHEVGFVTEAHRNQSWTLVLEGDLEERASLPSHGKHGQQYSHITTLKQESVSYLDGQAEVFRRCDSEIPCVTLHLYCPALAEA